MDLTLIAAVAKNGVIGSDGALPWHYPEDLTHFKETTMGHPVIMGRFTYESILDAIGTPLPGRTNVVLTRRRTFEAPEDVLVASSLADALAAARATGTDEAFVVGGETVYERCLPRADRLVLTELDAAYDGDAVFPSFDRSAWRRVSRDRREEMTFVVYEPVDRAGDPDPSTER
ncbi:dihydrofolate reductase (plasmid) [Haloferacaceae archaeon DSL9]